MGGHVGVKEILAAGGVTLFSLIALSVYSVALIWERWRFHRRATAGLKSLLERLRHLLKDGDLTEALTLGRQHKGLASSVVLASLAGPVGRDERKRSAERAAARGAAELSRGVTQLGTIATVAPFIGLFGTVLGVMRAFKDLATAAGAGPGVIAVGISEALICTAAGLFVAIPAVAAYNYFTARAARFSEEMDWISDEIIDLLADKAHHK